MNKNSFYRKRKKKPAAYALASKILKFEKTSFRVKYAVDPKQKNVCCVRTGLKNKNAKIVHLYLKITFPPRCRNNIQ